MGWYKEWFGTRYYALLYGHRDEGEAARWVRSILDRWEAPAGTRLLDMACGRGRHAYHFAQAGLDVTGIDLSPESIAEAKRHVPNGRFLVHDMRVTVEPGAFDLITCLFTSLGYSLDPQDDKATFRAVAANLRPGGRFALDFMNSRWVLDRLVPEETLVRDGVRFHISRTMVDGVIVKRIGVEDADQYHEYEERVRALMPETLEAMAVDAGLIVEDRTDGPDLTPYDPQASQRFVLWTRSPRPA
jgi:SAM-dependent methyltransferase